MEKRRQLAALLFTDIVGYTAMMQKDEQNAVVITKRYVSVLKQLVSLHGGEILNDYGDGSLCTFMSAREALRCSVELQQQLQEFPKVPLRIGLHIGEIFFEEEKVLGDGVNIASRIQSLAQANTILFSREIYDKIRNQPGFKCVSLGLFEFKNVDEAMEVFALANDGLTVPQKKDITGKLKENAKQPSTKIWIAIFSTLLILAAAVLFITHYAKGKNGYTGADKSVVVLPFENYTNDPEQEALINGITEEITTQLSKISDIKVIGRTSAVLYKKSKRSLDQIAEVLGVSAYLEGSVQKTGDRVRITAQLIDAHTQEHIWADHYDRDLKDIFTMQSDVAQQIAGQLHAKLTDEEKERLYKIPTSNVEAYQFYRKGRSFWDKRNKINFDSAEANYKRAIDLDPDYALAYSGLADLYIYNEKGLSQQEAIPICRDYVNKALSLDSTLSEALTTLGFIQSAFDYDWISAKKTLERALALNSNYPTAHLFYGNLLQYTGKNTEGGIREIKKALALDPLSVNLNYVLGRNYYYARQYDSSYEQLKKTLALNPDFSLAKGNLAYVLLALKRYPEALAVIGQLDSNATSMIRYYPATIRSYAYAASGNKELARADLEQSLQETPEQSPFFLAQVNIILSNNTEALSQLERAYNVRDLWMYIIKVDPTFDPIRNEPRFKALMKKMRLD
jgi:adenylate cyclase